MHPDHKATLGKLGAKLREARRSAGLSMPTLSALSGVEKGSISKIEHGGNVTALTLYRLCWAIGIHPRFVLPEFDHAPAVD